MNFWDSSAIVPLLVQDSASAGARAFYRANPDVVVWWGASVECVSALARLERDGRLDAGGVTRTLLRLQSLRESWHEVQPLEGVAQTAVRLLRVHPLRAADSLQLAAALVASDHRPQGWRFLCLDARLCAAAEREGFHVQREFAKK